MPASPSSTSANFMKVYESLPPEARKSLVEKKLAPLLDLVPKERAKKVMKSVNSLQTKYQDVPILDLKGKKKEIYGLLDELARDGKQGIIRERSNRDEILAEIVDSMLNWLNDIWLVVYEYNVHFEHAHACLLFTADILINTLSAVPGIGGHCKCSISFLAINFSLRRKGKIVKNFNLAGSRNIDRALLWIWRDLFVTMFARGILTDKIPEMLSDIEEILDWQALERVLYGGARRRSPTEDDEDDNYYEDMDDGCFADDVSDEDEENGSGRCPCRLHAPYWSDNVDEHRTELRELVYKRLMDLFELTPSYKIFTSLITISSDPDETEAELLTTLSQIAGCSADTLVAALDIHGSEGNPSALMTLLDEHSYLLRSRDAPVLQAAVSVLSDFASYNARALQIAEKELLDVARAVRAAVRTAFSRVEDKASTETLAEIAKLRGDAAQRRQRINAWVDSVLTPGAPASHPMMFAAMLMGFPLAAGMEDGDDEMDSLGYLDMHPRDPDLEDLREEFRPKLRERFDGWVSVVASTKGGSMMLSKLYAKIVEEMPYFKVNDVAEEMISRLSERPSKVHVTDGVDAVLAFCKTQRKRLAMRAEKRRKEAAKKAAASSGAADPSDTPPPLIPISPLRVPIPPPVPSSSSPFPAGIGGMEDVD
ncbi:hypothetical protein B0H16DRAFT_1541273 [Mycena metata]|uniref:Uncharacterized protein n=1 Tax=Mycena metata TaxID=1033252 RepID=A0AAD7ND14_9AGAR|nr:hypothetical protein B0H16DRAFT_1541273 [Mycena metata]